MGFAREGDKAFESPSEARAAAEISFVFEVCTRDAPALASLADGPGAGGAPDGPAFSRGTSLAAARATLEAVDAPASASARLGEGLIHLLGTRPPQPTASLAAFLRDAA